MEGMTGGWLGRREGVVEVEIDVEGNVSEGRGWENGYDEGASRGRDVGGFGGAAGVVRRSPRPRQCQKNGLRTPANGGP